MNKYIEVLEKNFTPENTLLILLGTILYFTMEFKAKQADHAFSIKIWFQENWYNIVISAVAIPAYFILVDSVGKLEAFGIGLAPNYLVDRINDLSNKYRNK